MASAKVTSKPETNEVQVADMAAALAAVIDAQHSDTLAADMAKQFVPLAGGEMAEYSAQVQYVEDILRQIITKLELKGMNGHTFAIQIETGKYAKCFGLYTRTKRLDTGATVLSVVIHIEDFALDVVNFVLKLLHAFAHTLTVAESVDPEKLEFGVGMNGRHTADFATNFHQFGTTTPADRSTGQNTPVALNIDILEILKVINLDPSAVILTGVAEVRTKRKPATVLRMACPTDPKHFKTSNIEKRYRTTRPAVDLDCGKCKADAIKLITSSDSESFTAAEVLDILKAVTKISRAGYEKHAPKS